jgi:hypothetical protein
LEIWQLKNSNNTKNFANLKKNNRHLAKLYPKDPFLVDPSTQLPTLSYPYNEILTVFRPEPYWAFHPIV